MGSSSKRQTTMAKLAREQAVKERRLRKQRRKDERLEAARQVKDDGSAVEAPPTS